MPREQKRLFVATKITLHLANCLHSAAGARKKALANPMNITLEQIRSCSENAESRVALWLDLVKSVNAKTVAEIGVYRGDFAASLLENCPSVETYYLLDPWRHLPGWNKPANTDDSTFERFMHEAISKTDFAANRRIFLRGTTTEVIDQIPDRKLDFAYIDGDHTLKGISIDLVRTYPKVRTGGWIGGDDFCSSVWQHDTKFEPTLVFPFAVYFAEAVGAKIFALPFNQFLIEKSDEQEFGFMDLTGTYTDTSLSSQIVFSGKFWKKLREGLPSASKAANSGKAAIKKFLQFVNSRQEF